MLGLVHSNIPAPEPIPPIIYIDHWPLGGFQGRRGILTSGKNANKKIYILHRNTYLSHWSLKKWLWRSDRKPVVHAWAYLLHREPRMSGHACAESASCSDGLVAWRGNGLWNRVVLPMLDPISTCLESVVPFATKKDRRAQWDNRTSHNWFYILRYPLEGDVALVMSLRYTGLTAVGYHVKCTRIQTLSLMQTFFEMNTKKIMQ